MNGEIRRGAMKAALAQDLRVLMSRKLFEKITIKQICDETGVIRATFYNYFDDKYDCLNWIVHMDFCSGEQLLYSAGPAGYFSGVLRTIEEEREFYQAGYRVNGQNSFQDMVTDNLAEILCRYLDHCGKKDFPSFRDRGFIASCYAQQLSHVLHRFVNENGRWSRQDAEQMIGLLLEHSFSEYIG